nr:xylulose kinase-1 [Tanacetum cinerariifolium]
MSSLFNDTYNVVAILEKSDAAEGFEQIIDFLSGSYIHYALTVNPHIYNSCIKQFWNTASVKRSGDVTRLQALVDKKKIVISEAVIREILQLNDAEGVNQVGDLSTHTIRFISPALTQKVFANMRRVGKENVAEDVSHDAILSPPPHDIPSPSQEPSSPPQQQHSSPQAPPQDAQFPTQLQQVLNVCFAFTKRVEHLKNDNVAQKLVIIKLKARVKRLEKANMVKSSKLRRLRKVGASKRVESSDDIEDIFNQGRMIDDMDMNERIELVKDAEVAESEGTHAAQQVEKQAKIYNLDLDHSLKVLSMQEDDSEVQEVVEVMTTAKLITEVVTAAASQVSAASATIPAAALTVVAAYTKRRKGVIIRDPEEELSLKTPAETPKVKDKGKGILVETPKPIKKKDQIELDAEYAKKLQEEINKDYEEFSKDIDWDAAMDHVNQKSKAAKRRKLSEEAQEAEDLRKCLEVVEDEDDDVFVEATPLASKTMFEEPDGQDAIWRNQKSVHGLALVKRWKLLTSCGVHVITLSTVQLFLLVERSEELTAAKHKLMLLVYCC